MFRRITKEVQKEVSRQRMRPRSLRVVLEHRMGWKKTTMDFSLISTTTIMLSSKGSKRALGPEQQMWLMTHLYSCFKTAEGLQRKLTNFDLEDFRVVSLIKARLNQHLTSGKPLQRMREIFEPTNTKGRWKKGIRSMAASSTMWLQCEVLQVKWPQGPAVGCLRIRVKFISEPGLKERIRGE